MNYYNEIKNELINNEVYKRVKDYSKNRNELSTYYNVGKLLIEAQGGEDRARYGDGLIKEYSERLTKELGKGYSIRSLKNMRKFYLIYQKGQAMPAQLTWSHYCELLSLKDINEINYYIDISIKQNLSYRKLKEKIKKEEKLEAAHYYLFVPNYNDIMIENSLIKDKFKVIYYSEIYEFFRNNAAEYLSDKYFPDFLRGLKNQTMTYSELRFSIMRSRFIEKINQR